MKPQRVRDRAGARNESSFFRTTPVISNFALNFRKKGWYAIQTQAPNKILNVCGGLRHVFAMSLRFFASVFDACVSLTWCAKTCPMVVKLVWHLIISSEWMFLHTFGKQAQLDGLNVNRTYFFSELLFHGMLKFLNYYNTCFLV